MTIIVDIDGTICSIPEDEDYAKAEPHMDRIQRVNYFYETGNEVIYWTARGTETGIDWEALTRKQLKDWGAQYSKLLFGKPYYNLWIDDKCMTAKDFFE